MINCSKVDPNCEYFYEGECYSCSENYGLFEKENKCLILSKYYDELMEKKMYILAAELNYGYLTIYIFFDFTLPYDFLFYIPITLNTKFYFRNLQESDELSFYFSNYDEKFKIGIFEYDLNYSIDDINEIEIDFNNIKDNKNHNIKYTIDTTYKENMDYDNYENSLLYKLNVNAYKVKGVITKGNNFTLIVDEDIYVEKEVRIQLIEVDNKNNIIEALCILSKDIDNKIPCSIEGEIKGKYYMKDYFYLNKETGELVSISMDKPSKNYIMNDDQDSTTSNSKNNKLSVGIIIIIILCSLIFVSIIGGIISIVLFIKKKRAKAANSTIQNINNQILQANGISSNNIL